MQDIFFVRVEEEQKELRSSLRDISEKLHALHVDVTALKARITVLSAGAVSLFGAMVWALQYLLTH